MVLQTTWLMKEIYKDVKESYLIYTVKKSTVEPLFQYLNFVAYKCQV